MAGMWINEVWYGFVDSATLAEWGTDQICASQAHLDCSLNFHLGMAHPPGSQYGHYQYFMEVVARLETKWSKHFLPDLRRNVHRVQRDFGVDLMVFPDPPPRGGHIVCTGDLISDDANDPKCRIAFTDDDGDQYQIVLELTVQAMEWNKVYLVAKGHLAMAVHDARCLGHLGTRLHPKRCQH